MTQPIRLWELSDEIQQLEQLIAIILENDSLTDDDRETKLQETFSKWLEAGESFKVKAELERAYVSIVEVVTDLYEDDISVTSCPFHNYPIFLARISNVRPMQSLDMMLSKNCNPIGGKIHIN